MIGTFIKAIYQIPSCIFFKDKKLRYVFATQRWQELNTKIILGKTDLEIRKDRENAIYAFQKDNEILETGKGTSYIIKSEVDGNIEYLEIIKEPVFNKRGKILGIVGLINNVTERVLLNQKMEEVSNTDWLTGVLNRKAGTYAIKSSLKEDNKAKMFCLLDVDNFKHFNDTYGHHVGDKILQEVAKALKDVAFERDVIMRIGGDEFVILLNNIKQDELGIFASKLFKRIYEIYVPGMINGEKITISLGITEITDDSTFDSLYMAADQNMYRAKDVDDNYYVYK